MVDENRPPVVVVERGARRAVRAPVRVLDRSRVVVVVIAVRRQVDVRGRQQPREDSRRDEQRRSGRPAEGAPDHARIMDHEAVARIAAWPWPRGPFQATSSRQVPVMLRSLDTA